ncbi:hypothetical protein LTR51_008821 [Lithohypha guttulata]|nr:hypothetical protein LTR51_008821 [Lithohypha guttulata]
MLLPLFGAEGPTPLDVSSYITDLGWFEITVTGIASNNATLLQASILEINDTHAYANLWKRDDASGQAAITPVVVTKRSYPSSTGYIWPSTLYDAFHVLNVGVSQQTTMTENYAAMWKAKTTQCASIANTTSELQLVMYNTRSGPVTEAVTNVNMSSNVIKHVFQQSGRVGIGEITLSSWMPDCIFAIRQERLEL